MTTLGWKILVEWKYGSVDWVPLKDLKQSSPVELDGCYVANEISDEPSFNWWVKETLRHIDRIIYKINLSTVAHHNSLFFTNTVKELYKIDRKSETTF